MTNEKAEGFTAIQVTLDDAIAQSRLIQFSVKVKVKLTLRQKLAILWGMDIFVGNVPALKMALLLNLLLAGLMLYCWR